MDVHDTDRRPLTKGPAARSWSLPPRTNPFTRYYAEILRAEGLNSFAVLDISAVTAATLTDYDVVILGEMALTPAPGRRCSRTG